MQRAEPPGSATDPPPRVVGGTNGEVSWLRDFTRLPGFPVAVLSEEPGQPWPGTRYSGGAAPGFHRLPSSPIRVSSVFLLR
jgi:hypothetical protein